MIDIEVLITDREAMQEQTEDKLERIVKLANMLANQQEEVARLEEELKKACEAEKKIECQDFPELMKELGIKDFTLADGSVVQLISKINCSISEARRPEAHQWLINNNFGGLIKTEVFVPFDRGAVEEAAEFYASLTEDGIEAFIKESVHAQTLKSFVKEQLEEGKPLPLDLFGVFQYDIVEVTLPKEPKKKAKKSI